MTIQMVLLFAGTVLLGWTALLGFAPRRFAPATEAFARWRLVHAAGTAGAVQLIALAGAWRHFSPGELASSAAIGVTIATWSFTLGPLFAALGRATLSRRTNWVGAVFAVPAYVGLPLSLPW